MKLNLTRRFSNLRFKRAASMSCAKCLGHANSQNERWKKRTRVTVIFPLCFDRYVLGRKKKDPKYGETEVIQTEKIRIRMCCRCPQSSLLVPTFGIVNTKTLRDYLHISNSSNL